MFMIIKKKHILAIVCIVVLATALFVNVKYDLKKEKQTELTSETDFSDTPDSGEAILVSTKEDYYIKAKNDREIVRGKSCELLNETIQNPSVSEESRKLAEEKIIKMSEDMDKELKCESILKAKGYSDSIVFISDKTVTVTITASELKEADIAKINDIIFQETGNNNIKIVEVG